MEATPTVTLAEVGNDFILAIWLQVYKKLGRKDQAAGRLVCKTLARELGLQVKDVSVDEVASDEFTQQDLEDIARGFPNIENLSISLDATGGSDDPEVTFETVSFPKLEHLHTSSLNMPNIHFARTNTPCLKTLTIAHTRDALHFHLDLPDLVNMDFEFVTIEDDSELSDSFNRSPNLESFSSYKFWGPSDVLDLNLPNATSLSFYRSDSLQGVDLVAPKLRSLNLQACYSLCHVRIAPDPAGGPPGPKISVNLRNANLDPVSLRHLKLHPRVGKRRICRDDDDEFGMYDMPGIDSGDDDVDVDEFGNALTSSSGEDLDEDDDDGTPEVEFLAMLQAMASQFASVPPEMVMAAMARGAAMPMPANVFPPHGLPHPFPIGLGTGLGNGGMFFQPGSDDEDEMEEDDDEAGVRSESEWETDEEEDGSNMKVDPITDPAAVTRILAGGTSRDAGGSAEKVEVKFSICNAGLEGWEPDEGEELTEDDYSPYVSLADPEEYVKHMRSPDDVVIPTSSVSVLVDYPLSAPVIVPMQSDDSAGFKRAELAQKISHVYKQLYKKEEKRSRVAVGRVPGLMNRNQTNGPYGIWGHDLGDLLLHSVTYNPNSKVVELGVDS